MGYIFPFSRKSLQTTSQSTAASGGANISLLHSKFTLRSLNKNLTAEEYLVIKGEKTSNSKKGVIFKHYIGSTASWL